MMKLLMLAPLVLCGLANADVDSTKPASYAGSWHMVVPAETADLVRKMGLPKPTAILSLTADRTFTYSADAGGQKLQHNGKFEVKEGSLWLYGDKDAWTRVAKVGNDGLEIDGLKFTKDESFNLLGKWVLDRGGNLDISISVNFAKDGTFSFRCSNATSKGKYLVEGRTVTLLWTEVDGEKIELGTMKKTLTLTDGGSFKIDQFHYIKG
ncbi:MAG: hypothetical protein ABL949_10475 [Fimbriimonadaceae bacterium]